MKLARTEELVSLLLGDEGGALVQQVRVGHAARVEVLGHDRRQRRGHRQVAVRRVVDVVAGGGETRSKSTAQFTLGFHISQFEIRPRNGKIKSQNRICTTFNTSNS